MNKKWIITFLVTFFIIIMISGFFVSYPLALGLEIFEWITKFILPWLFLHYVIKVSDYFLKK